ncbi:hypothetical protein M758_12G053000 [Ceratodon purpureus]|nr:hypothetical protein M758_12G053000 [Ceratodon purpureus]
MQTVPEKTLTHKKTLQKTHTYTQTQGFQTSLSRLFLPPSPSSSRPPPPCPPRPPPPPHPPPPPRSAAPNAPLHGFSRSLPATIRPEAGAQLVVSPESAVYRTCLYHFRSQIRECTNLWGRLLASSWLVI